MSTINGRKLNLIFICLVMFLLVMFTMFADAVPELKTSNLNGGKQYWWEAEDFDDRDENVMLLKDEPGSSVPDLTGAYGDQYIVHNAPNPPIAVEGKDFLEYKVRVKTGGKYYVWARASWDRTPGGRTHNSMYVQVNGKPDIGAFAKHVNTLADANWPVDADENNPWAWVGDSAQPAALQGQAGGGLTNGLVMDFKSGENTFMIYHREGAVANNTLCTDVIMISTVDFVPTDADYENSTPELVKPMGKLTTTWAQLKTSR
ncbi:hypothetical protein H8E77_21830 [bacterium]|nr:hypothetical protein [bacterium]